MNENITLQDVFKKLVSIEAKAEETNQSLEAIKRDLHYNKTKVDELEKENKQLKEKLGKIEQKERNNNIVVYGLSSQDSVDEGIKELELLLGVTIQKSELNSAYFLGKSRIQNTARPMKIEFLSNYKKSEVLTNGYKLKGKNIYMNHDYTKEEQAINKFLRGIVSDANKNNKKAAIKKNRLILVNGKTYTYDQLRSNPGIQVQITGDNTNSSLEAVNISEDESEEESDEENRQIHNERNKYKQHLTKSTAVNKKSPRKRAQRKRVL